MLYVLPPWAILDFGGIRYKNLHALSYDSTGNTSQNTPPPGQLAGEYKILHYIPERWSRLFVYVYVYLS
jgi:hypothetical protein